MNQPYLDISCKTWSKNSFGLFNYHNANIESDMVKTFMQVTGNDTKILRHEKHIDESLLGLMRNNKMRQAKKILVTLTAKDSELVEDPDTETMDLNKKE